MPNERQTAELRREMVLTQYGRRDASGFRVRPRPGVEEGISLIAGRLDVATAHRLVVRRGLPRAGVDSVRSTTVGDLEGAGFVVRAAATRAIPDHVIVGYEGQWDDQVAERIAIEQGQQPWLPSEDAELVETLHHYDMPLIGVIRQGDALHLFRCIEGQLDAIQVWAYVRITPDELEAVRGAGPDDLDALLDQLVDGKPTVVALADDQRGLTLSTLVGDLGSYPSPLHAARAALGEALNEVDSKLGRSVA